MNRDRTLALPVTCVAMAMVLGGCGVFPSKSATRTSQFDVPIPASGKCVIQSKNGTIRCVAGSVTEIKVEAVITARATSVEKAEYGLDEISIDRSETEDGAEIVANVPRGINGGVSFQVTVPAEMTLHLKTSNGSIEVTGVSGDVVCDTSNGAVNLIDCSGEVDVDTSNGKVSIEGESLANVKAKTSNGSVWLKGNLMPGSHQIRTSNGSIQAELTGTPVTVTSTTSNGSIRVNGQKRNKGESVSIGQAADSESESKIDSAELSLRTSNGSITIEHQNAYEQS